MLGGLGSANIASSIDPAVKPAIVNLAEFTPEAEVIQPTEQGQIGLSHQLRLLNRKRRLR